MMILKLDLNVMNSTTYSYMYSDETQVICSEPPALFVDGVY